MTINYYEKINNIQDVVQSAVLSNYTLDCFEQHLEAQAASTKLGKVALQHFREHKDVYLAYLNGDDLAIDLDALNAPKVHVNPLYIWILGLNGAGKTNFAPLVIQQFEPQIIAENGRDLFKARFPGYKTELEKLANNDTDAKVELHLKYNNAAGLVGTIHLALARQYGLNTCIQAVGNDPKRLETLKAFKASNFRPFVYFFWAPQDLRLARIEQRNHQESGFAIDMAEINRNATGLQNLLKDILLTGGQAQTVIYDTSHNGQALPILEIRQNHLQINTRNSGFYEEYADCYAQLEAQTTMFTIEGSNYVESHSLQLPMTIPLKPALTF